MEWLGRRGNPTGAPSVANPVLFRGTMSRLAGRQCQRPTGIDLRIDSVELRRGAARIRTLYAREGTAATGIELKQNTKKKTGSGGPACLRRPERKTFGMSHVRFARAADRRSPIDSCGRVPGSSRGNGEFLFLFFYSLYSFSFLLFAFTERGHDLERGCDGDPLFPVLWPASDHFWEIRRHRHRRRAADRDSARYRV
jgi:hypothetical protein